MLRKSLPANGYTMARVSRYAKCILDYATSSTPTLRALLMPLSTKNALLSISWNPFLVHCVGWDNIHRCVHYCRNIYGDVGGLDPQTEVTFCMCSPIQCEWGSDRGGYRVLAPCSSQAWHCYWVSDY